MSAHTPITGEELKEIKRRCLNAPLDCMGSRLVLSIGGKTETVWGKSEADARKIALCMHDLPRCIAEIERLNTLLDSRLTDRDVTPDFNIKPLKPHKYDCTRPDSCSC